MKARQLARRHPFCLSCLALLALLGPVGCGRRPVAPDPAIIQLQLPRPVIFDTDMAHEDMFAALFLLAHPNVDVRAITVTGTGEAHCAPGVARARGLIAVAGREGIPVACGRETPLAGSHEFPAGWRARADAAYGVAISAPGQAAALSAPDLIADILRDATGGITIVAVGPLTNLAEVIQNSPELTAAIEGIYVMGGAVGSRGNVGNSGVGIANEYAEWNIYIDPAAADIVFKAGIPITLVPLDATGDVPITREFYDALADQRNTPTAGLVYDLLTANLDFVGDGGFQFWDSLTAAIFTDAAIATFEEIPLRVVVAEGAESGRTLQDPDGAMMRVAVAADRAKFEQTLITILNWEE